MFTVDTLAAYLNVPKSRIYRWNREGNGPPMIRLGHRVIRYKPEDVDEWVTEHQIQQAEAG